MTAAELANFRALLQAQAAGQPRPDRGLFARMRARLTVVEGGAAVATADRSASAPAAPPAPALVAEEPQGAGPVADPPPSQPPVFGRRDALPFAEAAEIVASRVPPAGPAGEAAVPVRLVRRFAASFTDASTPDELADPREEEEEAPLRSQRPAPGVISGWSRARPPSAQRRLLSRLEAVLLAEREGLDARRAADAPAG